MNYGRGGNESTEVVDIASGEPVRFGNHSLKLNYDFSQCGAVTEGACVGLENPSRRHTWNTNRNWYVCICTGRNTKLLVENSAI